MATEYFVNGLWPKRRLNLISGASGAGKTRWIVPQLFALLEGRPIMGEPTKPTKVAYVACDRTSEDARDTMSDLGHDPSKMPIFSFMDNELEWTFANVVTFVPPGTELVFIEAIAALVPGGSIIDYHSILKLGRFAHKTTRTTGFNFWGSTHTPKMKKGEDFKHTRDNVIGSSAWPGISGTIVHIVENDQGQREIHILPRDFEPRIITCEFDASGHLVECSKIIGTVIMDMWLNKLEPETLLTTDQIMEQGTRAKVSRRTVFRWIDDKVNEGRLLKVGQGTYQTRARM